MKLFLQVVAAIVLLLAQHKNCSGQITKSKADSTLKAALATKPRQAMMQALYDGAIKFRHNEKLEKLFANAFWVANKKQPVDTNMAKGLYLLADVEMGEGAYEVSLQHALRGIEIATAKNMHTLKAELLADVAGIYLRTDNIDESLIAMKEAVALAHNHGNYRQYAHMLNFLSIRYAIKNEIPKALSVLDSASQVAQLYGFKAELYEILLTKANIYASNNEHDKAINELLKALPVTRTLSPAEQTYVYFLLGRTYSYIRNYKIAEQYLDTAIAKLDNVDDPDLKLSVYDVAYRAYLVNGNLDGGDVIHRNYRLLRDSLFTAEKSAAVLDIKTKYETDIKDNQIAAQKTQLSLNQKVNLFLIISIVFVVIIGVIIFISQRRTKLLNIEIAKQSAELQGKTLELEAKSIELERLNNVKDRLFSTISHDMREPINSLLSFTTLLEEGDIAPKDMALYAGNLKNSLGYTSSLMANLLEFSRSQLRGFSAKMDVIDLAHVASDAISLFVASAQTKNVKVINNIPPDAKVYADIDMLALVIRNLVSNAIKFTEPGGMVTVYTNKAADNVLALCVEDTGIGIAPENVVAFNMATDTGTQPLASTLGTAREKGTGLGLLLCKNLIGLMRGTLTLTSQQGKGSTFTIGLVTV